VATTADSRIFFSLVVSPKSAGSFLSDLVMSSAKGYEVVDMVRKADAVGYDMVALRPAVVWCPSPFTPRVLTSVVVTFPTEKPVDLVVISVVVYGILYELLHKNDAPRGGIIKNSILILLTTGKALLQRTPLRRRPEA
jgi:hypothetical protein